MVKVSVVTCMFLAIDQWFVLCRPQQHQNTFGGKRVKIFLWSTWIISAVTATVLIFSVKNDGERCVPTQLFGMGPETQQMVVMVQTAITVFVPCMVTWFSIGALLCQRKNLRVQRNKNKSDEKRLVMCSAVVLTVTFSWFFEEVTAIVQVYASNSNVRRYARMLALCASGLVPCICFTMGEELRQQVKLLFVGCGSTREDENSTTDQRREDCEVGNTVIAQEEENGNKNTMKKRHSFERENALNQEKDRLQENIIHANGSERIVFDTDENKHQSRAPQQLSVRRESQFDIMEAERSPSAARYVKRGEMTTIAMIW